MICRPFETVSDGVAGEFESWLGINDLPECERRILECWIAAWSPRALRYLRRIEIQPRPFGMAVMLQSVVDANFRSDRHGTSRYRESVAIRGASDPRLSLNLLSGTGVRDAFHVEWDSGSGTVRILDDQS